MDAQRSNTNSAETASSPESDASKQPRSEHEPEQHDASTRSRREGDTTAGQSQPVPNPGLLHPGYLGASDQLSIYYGQVPPTPTSLPTPTTHTFPAEARSPGPADRPAAPEQPFDFIEELSSHRDIMLQIASDYMHPDDVFTLHTVSRAFHFLVTGCMTTYVSSAARRWASLQPTRRVVALDVDGGQHMPPAFKPGPRDYGRYAGNGALDVLSWKKDAYRRLCTEVLTPVTPEMLGAPRPDPAQHSDTPPHQSIYLLSVTPQWQYLRLLCARAAAVHRILYTLTLTHGFRLPARSGPVVLIKLSALADLPTTRERLAYADSSFTAHELYVAVMFMVKLDMAFADPVDAKGRGERVLRALLLAQRGGSEMLRYIDGVLRRELPRDRYELLQMWVRWRYRGQQPPRHRPRRRWDDDGAGGQEEGGGRDQQSSSRTAAPRAAHVFDVPNAEWGSLGKEHWKPGWSGARRLMPLDEVIIAASLQRRLALRRQIYGMMIWGHVDYRTLTDVPMPTEEDADDVGLGRPEGWTVPGRLRREWRRLARRAGGQVDVDVDADAAQGQMPERVGLTDEEREELAALMQELGLGAGQEQSAAGAGVQPSQQGVRDAAAQPRAATVDAQGD